MCKMVTSKTTSSQMLRGVIFEEVVFSSSFQADALSAPKHSRIIELCRLKKDDDADEQPDETEVFCNSGFSV